MVLLRRSAGYLKHGSNDEAGSWLARGDDASHFAGHTPKLGMSWPVLAARPTLTRMTSLE